MHGVRQDALRASSMVDLEEGGTAQYISEGWKSGAVEPKV